MTSTDTLAERAQAASDRLARQDEVRSKLSEELAEDAQVLRDQPAIADIPVSAPPAPKLDSSPKPGAPPKRSGPNPFVVIGVALLAGFVLAKLIDRRGHGHSRR